MWKSEHTEGGASCGHVVSRRGLMMVANDNVGAGLREQLRRGGANAARAAGDNGTLAFK